ncbi:MAG: hypothetical protein OXI50_03830 [Gammaproteobacteria bacterium]|nr:hypothetical protein [Gammaproteobacteria bacterium]MYD00353.1 hypothetical protein [Gammaproteobacteria bacterium]
MAPSAAQGKGLKPAGLLRLVVLAASLCAVVPSAATSQDVEQSEYRAAESAYNAALRARDLERDLLDDALDEVTEARQSGDQARYERALAIYQDQARELEQSERELTDAAGRLEQVRRSYLLSVLDELDELYEELPQAPDARGRDLIGRRIDILLADANQLERPIEIDDDPFPAINIEPGDTPDEIRAKADLLERYAAGYDLLVLDIDAQIELVEQRQRHARMVRDFGADLSRFGDLRVPMGRPDATSDNAEDLIGGEELSQRLEELQQSREFVIERRDVARARAEEFRQRIGGEWTA